MKRHFLAIVAMVLSMYATAQVDPNFHIYLCFGQSNMQGSAPIGEEEKVGDGRFWVISPSDFENINRKQGEWYIATPPLSQPWAKLSIADGFGRAMVDRMPEEVKVGVAVVAVGGCDIRLFDKDLYLDYLNTYPDEWFANQVKSYGGDPYGRLVHIDKLAQRQGVIKGIILHQGETNTGNKDWPKYVEKVYNNLLEDLRLEAEDVPLIAGEVVDSEHNGTCASMNTIINTLPEEIPTAYVVSSAGCSCLSDCTHFDTAGVKELGKRYAEKMIEVKRK